MSTWLKQSTSYTVVRGNMFVRMLHSFARAFGHVSPCRWAKPVLPGTPLFCTMSAFGLHFSQKLLKLVTYNLNDNDLSEKIDASIKERGQASIDSEQAPEKRRRDKVVTRKMIYLQIARPRAFTSIKPGDLVVVREASCCVQKYSDK